MNNILKIFILSPIIPGLAIIWSKIPTHIADADWPRYLFGMFLICLPAILFLIVRWTTVNKDNKTVGEFGTH